ERLAVLARDHRPLVALLELSHELLGAGAILAARPFALSVVQRLTVFPKRDALDLDSDLALFGLADRRSQQLRDRLPTVLMTHSAGEYRGKPEAWQTEPSEVGSY